VQRAWALVEQRLAQYQTIATAVIANRARIDGVAGIVQQPDWYDEEVTYVQETVRESYAQREATRGR
jgi:hypothetical protein